MVDLVAGLVDVFADSPLSGNPLAVVECVDHAPDEDVMRRVAREFNQAETTFLFPSVRADWKLRSFTASGAEVFGAGHNALGAWLWLADTGKLGKLDRSTQFHQEIGDEILPIVLETRDGRTHVRMRQGPLRLSPPLTEAGPLARALGLSEQDLVAHPPPRTADTGAPHLMVRSVDRQTVDRATPNAEALVAVLGPAGAEGCYLYALESAAGAYARFFNPTVGLWEDSATGTAAGPLCAYLRAAGVLSNADELVVEQGVRMGRRSLLRVRLTPDAELSGSGLVVFRGMLTI